MVDVRVIETDHSARTAIVRCILGWGGLGPNDDAERRWFVQRREYAYV